MRVAESSAEGKSIYAHDPTGKASHAYLSLVEGVLKMSNHSAGKIKIAGYNDLFGESIEHNEKIIEVPLTDLYSFKLDQNMLISILNVNKKKDLKLAFSMRKLLDFSMIIIQKKLKKLL